MFFIRSLIVYAIELLFLVIYFPVALVARFLTKPVDVGIGPRPIVSHQYHKAALKQYGWSAETFVDEVYTITQDFDVQVQKRYRFFPAIVRRYLLFFFCIFRYKCLYLYFTGGALSLTRFLYRIEPFLYRFAGVKTVLICYGSDVQEMSRSFNLLFKQAMSVDYPSQSRKRQRIESKIDIWMNGANHVVGGNDWVDFLPGWDSLTLNHFAVDLAKWQVNPTQWNGPQDGPLRILHAPNHREIKGSQFFETAITNLQKAGYHIELVFMTGVPNTQVKEMMSSCHIIADQLVMGWYAMFAIEGMALGKPVLCNLRTDYVELYRFAGLIEKDEIPVVDVHFENVEQKIKELYENPSLIREYGRRGREYVEKHHSLEYIGRHFDGVNKNIGLTPLHS